MTRFQPKLAVYCLVALTALLCTVDTAAQSEAAVAEGSVLSYSADSVVSGNERTTSSSVLFTPFATGPASYRLTMRFDYAATAPVHGTVSDNWSSRQWTSCGTASVLANFGEQRQTTLFASAEAETYVDQENMKSIVQSGSQEFTARAGISHLLTTGNGSSGLEVNLNGYAQRLALAPLITSGGAFNSSPGAALQIRGMEASVAIPAAHTAFSVNYGTVHVQQGRGRSPVVTFGIAITW